MLPEERAKYLVEQLGKEGALRQCYEEIGNADTIEEIEYQYKIIDAINTL